MVTRITSSAGNNGSSSNISSSNIVVMASIERVMVAPSPQPATQAVAAAVVADAKITTTILTT